jgi:hypothetical protein
MKGFKKYTAKQVKMAIGIAFDKRYVQGNMTGAVNAIEKIAKGLSEIEPVRNALRRANEEVVNEGTWAVPKTPKQKSALKKLLSKPLKAKGATDKLYDIIGDDELFDQIDDFASTEPNADVRSMVKTAMKRLGIKEETILDRIDRKLKERKELHEASNRWELGGKKFSLVNDKGTWILVTQGTGTEKKLKARTQQQATAELVKKGYRES